MGDRTISAFLDGEDLVGVYKGMFLTSRRTESLMRTLHLGLQSWGPFPAYRLEMVGWSYRGPVCLGYPNNDSRPFAVTCSNRFFGPFQSVSLLRFLKMRDHKPLYLGDDPQCGMGLYLNQERLEGPWPGARLIPGTADRTVQVLVRLDPKDRHSRLRVHTIRL